jgi:hypothetical protein
LVFPPGWSIYLRCFFSRGLKKIMKKISLVLAIAFGAVFFAWSQANGGQAKKSQLDGTWELVAGQHVPKGAREIKIFSGGHFIFATYDTEKGELLNAAGGTYILNGSSYSEHVDFGERIAAGIVGKDQQFTAKIDGDTFVQGGTLSNGIGLLETWKRIH